MADLLGGITNAIAVDPGLNDSISDRKIAKGLKAASELNTLLLAAIERSGVNKDGLLSARDMARISAEVYDKPAQYVAFLEAHGNDNGDVVTGYHHVQNDGGTLEFQGRNFIDTVADAIYHYGFKVRDGRYVNEDGAANETARDVAGWLNYFLNGENVVWGSGRADQMGSGDYSRKFQAAANETFYAGGGADKIWGGVGNDNIHGEAGNDESGGGVGRDRMFGGSGDDRLGGDAHADRLWGGAGKDMLYGGDGNDRLYGGAEADGLNGGNGSDLIHGGAGRDRLDGSESVDRLYGGGGGDTIYGGNGNDMAVGGSGNDNIAGGDGRDRLFGKSGNDTLSAGSGADKLIGGEGADHFQLWEEKQSTDTLVFAPGDSGRFSGRIDHVEGFDPAHDLIDLSAFDGLVLRKIDFAGGGLGSAYYDGTYLRIDADGDRATDMMIAFRYVGDLGSDNFIL